MPQLVLIAFLGLIGFLSYRLWQSQRHSQYAERQIDMQQMAMQAQKITEDTFSQAAEAYAYFFRTAVIRLHDRKSKIDDDIIHAIEMCALIENRMREIKGKFSGDVFLEQAYQETLSEAQFAADRYNPDDGVIQTRSAVYKPRDNVHETLSTLIKKTEEGENKPDSE